MRAKIVDQNTLLEQVQKQRIQRDVTVVSTSGCFDILHSGHVEYLEEAKKKGDLLVVMLNADVSVEALKGKGRPVVKEMDRAIVLAGLEAVDYVCIFQELTPCRLICQLQPDVIIKGGDYKGKQIPEMEAVASYGGRVEYVLLMEGRSTTNIIEEIINRRTDVQKS